MHPLLFSIAGIEIPYGQNEYDAVGGMLKEPIEVILGPKTGLPIPANAEIAFEGTIDPNDRVEEGPFGEWTGYYAGGRKKEPVIRIDTFMHRNDPILLGAIPAVPPNDDTFYRGTFRCAAVWRQLEAAGVPGIQGVWAHEAGGSRMWLTISIKQMYPGHSKQAGLIASQCHAGAYANKYVIVVDDDVNPANMNDVIWAMCTRVDAREDVEILRACWSTTLDPTSYPNDLRALNSRMVIDACRPWARRGDFPKVARSSRELDERIKAKWAHVLPRDICVKCRVVDDEETLGRSRHEKTGFGDDGAIPGPAGAGRLRRGSVREGGAPGRMGRPRSWRREEDRDQRHQPSRGQPIHQSWPPLRAGQSGHVQRL